MESVLPGSRAYPVERMVFAVLKVWSFVLWLVRGIFSNGLGESELDKSGS